MYKVLLIDDESWVLEDLKTLVDWNDLGFDVVGEAKNIEEVRALIHSDNPDLIISDIRMPSMNGIDFMEEYYQEYKPGQRARIVFVTAYGKFEYAKKAVDLGAFGYLLKPVEPEELAATLNRVRSALDTAKGITEKIKRLENTRFIYSVIDGYGKFEDIKEELESMGILAAKTPMVVLDVKSEEEISASMFPLAAQWHVVTVPISKRKNMVILQSKSEQVGIIAYKNLISELNKVTEREPVSIGVSRLMSDIKKIRTGFLQADTALDTEFLNKKKLNVYRDRQSVYKEVLAFINYGKSNNCLPDTVKKLPEELVKQKINIENFMPILQYLANQMGILSEIEDLDSKEIVNQFKDVSALMDYLITCMNDNIKRGSGKTTSRYVIKEITEYIKNNYNQKLMINSLAQRFFLNSSYLSNLFKVETGKSFTNYLVECRLSKAVELLENTDLSLYEISAKVGYDDYFHFSKLFKKYMNTSPANYRKVRMKNQETEEAKDKQAEK